MNLPEKYTESMKMMLGDEYDSYIESFNDKRLYGLRVNNPVSYTHLRAHET